MTLTLDPLDVHVRYRLIDEAPDERYAQALDTLSADERARAARFVFPRDRVMFVAAHDLLRQALSEYEDVDPAAWTFGQEAGGKPRLADRYAVTGIRFNLAHTRGLVACAIARDTDIGVDVESIDAVTAAMEVAARFFSPSEAAHLQACAESHRQTRFIELWTLKEAYIKAIGEGLSHPLHTFSFTLDGGSSLRFEPPPLHGDASDASRDGDELPRWQFGLIAPSASHRMAVAVRCPRSEMRRVTVWADAQRPAPMIVSSTDPMYTCAVQPGG
jgi:4'-phosphopantetheinyl transferase